MHDEDETRPNRRRPRQQRAQQTVETVLQGAVRVLARDGLDAVTTNRIAEAAGVSIGSVYQYFPDKRAIFLALHERHAQRIQGVIQRTLDAHAAAPLEPLIVALMDGLFDEHAADPRELHALLDQQDDGSRGLRQALGEVLMSRRPEPALPPEKVQLVIPAMMDVLVHEAMLSPAGGCDLAAAKAEASRAVVSYLRA
ncbi:MAG TPA: helix-turn-helix domain-containing protein [Polyangia bacterium]